LPWQGSPTVAELDRALWICLMTNRPHCFLNNIEQGSIAPMTYLQSSSWTSSLSTYFDGISKAIDVTRPTQGRHRRRCYESPGHEDDYVQSAIVTGILGPVPLVKKPEVISEAIKEWIGRCWSALIAHPYMVLPSASRSVRR
jgi:hypothetical protein